MLGACTADVLMNFSLVFSSATSLSPARARGGHGWVAVWILVDVAMNVVLGFMPYVDNFCHVGGMVFGFLFAWGTMERMSFEFFDVNR